MKLFYIDKKFERLAYNKHVFAEDTLDAINLAYPDNLSVEHQRGTDYCVQFARDCYEFINVTEVEIKRGMTL